MRRLHGGPALISKVPRAVRERILAQDRDVGDQLSDPPPVTTHPEPLHHFLALSSALTGFTVLELEGTGVGRLYLDFLLRVFADVLPELLRAWRKLPSATSSGHERGLRAQILEDPKWGPFAQGLTALWYTATWTPMTPEWSTAFGQHHDAFDSGLTAAAYTEGLMWRTSPGAHPQGTKPTGFGSWAVRPEGA